MGKWNLLCTLGVPKRTFLFDKVTINLRQWSYHSLCLHNPGCCTFAKDLQELDSIRYTLQFGSCLHFDRPAVISDEGWHPGCTRIVPSGTNGVTKTEKFQTAFDSPPPHFRKIMSQICIHFMLKKPCLKVQKLQHNFLDWKWPPSPLDIFIRFGDAICPLHSCYLLILRLILLFINNNKQ